jgi:DnaJ-class molecular chaperone
MGYKEKTQKENSRQCRGKGRWTKSKNFGLFLFRVNPPLKFQGQTQKNQIVRKI